MSHASNLRRIGFTLWTALAVALGAAVCGNAATEWLADAAVFGPGPLDLHHESLLPTALCAVVVTGSLAVALLLQPQCERPNRLVLYPLAALLAFATVVAMEGYEVQFGGSGAFDPGSVLVSHAPCVLIAYAVIGAAIERFIDACMRVVRGIAPAFVALVLALRRRQGPTGGGILAVVRARFVTARRPQRLQRLHGLRAPPGREFTYSRLLGRLSWGYVFRGP